MDLRHPPAEVRVDASVVEHLVRAQHPGLLAGRPELIDEGWDNFTFRLGPEHAVRIPRRLVAVDLLLNEQRWLPVLANRIPLRVPLPVGIGAPTDDYPWPWSVVAWIPGETAPPASLGTAAGEMLAGALRALQSMPPPPGAPENPFRGVPLGVRRAVVEERLDRLGRPELDRLWAGALAAPPSREPVWLHGDLHPRNVIVRGGALVGLIDWGDMAVGDSATDLACAWMLFDERGRRAFLEAYGPTEAEIARATGWAVNFGSALLDSGEDRHAELGRATLGALLVR